MAYLALALRRISATTSGKAIWGVYITFPDRADTKSCWGPGGYQILLGPGGHGNTKSATWVGAMR